MALYCVTCGVRQPDDDPPLKPGVVCVACEKSDTFTTLAPAPKLVAWRDLITPEDRRYLRTLKIAVDLEEKA